LLSQTNFSNSFYVSYDLSPRDGKHDLPITYHFTSRVVLIQEDDLRESRRIRQVRQPDASKVTALYLFDLEPLA
jgi:tRNA(His) 5'-end guanylyltransferase